MAKKSNGGEFQGLNEAVSYDGAAEYEPLTVHPIVTSNHVETRATVTFMTHDQSANDIARDIENGSLYQFGSAQIETVRIVERRVITMRRIRVKR